MAAKVSSKRDLVLLVKPTKKSTILGMSPIYLVLACTYEGAVASNVLSHSSTVYASLCFQHINSLQVQSCTLQPLTTTTKCSQVAQGAPRSRSIYNKYLMMDAALILRDWRSFRSGRVFLFIIPFSRVFVLLVLVWHQSMAILSFELDQLFTLLVPELVELVQFVCAVIAQSEPDFFPKILFRS